MCAVGKGVVHSRPGSLMRCDPRVVRNRIEFQHKPTADPIRWLLTVSGRGWVLIQPVNRATTALGWCRPQAAFANRKGRSHSQCFSNEGYQSAAAAAGCYFIISSIPFFISLAVGSALWVPTIQA
jgi:hypothetical protein